MQRWAIFTLLLIVVIFAALVTSISSGAAAKGLAQSTVVGTPMVITAQAATVMPAVTAMPDGSGGAQPGTLVLTLQDNGGTYTVPIGGEIILMIPRLPNMQLHFDPTILQLLIERPVPLPDGPSGGISNDPSMNPPAAFPAGGWRLLAIQPGVTILTALPLPCTKPPCPMTPIFSFSVTIVVRGGVNPPQPGGSETYISTAFLDQTVVVQIGQTVRLDLPYLSDQQKVVLQYNLAVLQPVYGQDLSHTQRNGWRFLVIGPGISPLVVLTELCADDYGEGTTCATQTVFRVTVTTSPASK